MITDPLKTPSAMFMNTQFLRHLALWLASAALGHAQTIQWGSPVWSKLLDNSVTETALASGSYAFELGTFGSFVPTDDNIVNWAANWKPFDTATYREAKGYFGSSAIMDPLTGLSSNSIGGQTNFAGQSAFLWVRNTAGANGAFSTAGQYVLARNASWTFPVLNPSPGSGCCENELPLQWSVSDLVANETCPAAPTDVPIIKTGTTGNSGLVYSAGSVFQWDLNSHITDPADRGTAYAGVDVVGNITIEPNAIFKIILHDGGDFSDPFWKEQHTWNNILTATGGITATWNPSQVLVYNSDDCCNPLAVGDYGRFSFSGSSLTFTPVPEPTGAIVSLLLAGGLLRRHRPAVRPASFP